MSDERIRSAAEFSNRMRAQQCTTPGHEERKGRWLIDRDDPSEGQRWVCDECAGR